jgi:hypothetical protein
VSDGLRRAEARRLRKPEDDSARLPLPARRPRILRLLRSKATIATNVQEL